MEGRKEKHVGGSQGNILEKLLLLLCHNQVFLRMPKAGSAEKKDGLSCGVNEGLEVLGVSQKEVIEACAPSQDESLP